MSQLMVICAIYDYKADSFGAPMNFQSRPEAMRQLQHAVQNNKESQLHQFPQDFGIFQIASYEAKTGSLSPFAKPELICNAIDFKQN